MIEYAKDAGHRSTMNVCVKYLRNTNGIPPRIALLPSNTACLL